MGKDENIVSAKGKFLSRSTMPALTIILMFIGVVWVSETSFAGQAVIGKVKAWPKPDGWHGVCPKELKFYGNITINNSPSVVNYHWERNDGAKGPETAVEVKPGQKQLSMEDNWTVGKSGGYQEVLVVNSGRQHIRMGTHPVKVTCK